MCAAFRSVRSCSYAKKTFIKANCALPPLLFCSVVFFYLFFDQNKGSGWYFSKNIRKNHLQKNDSFQKTVAVFLQSTSCFLICCFLTKKRAKGEISHRIWEKTARKKTTFFTKRNGFFAGVHHVFLIVFWQKKGQKVRFQREFQKKPPAKKRQFSQNVTVFLQGTSCFFSYFLTKKRGKGEISHRIWEKTARKKTTFFTKRNGFFAGYIMFF